MNVFSRLERDKTYTPGEACPVMRKVVEMGFTPFTEESVERFKQAAVSRVKHPLTGYPVVLSVFALAVSVAVVLAAYAFSLTVNSYGSIAGQLWVVSGGVLAIVIMAILHIDEGAGIRLQVEGGKSDALPLCRDTARWEFSSWMPAGLEFFFESAQNYVRVPEDEASLISRVGGIPLSGSPDITSWHVQCLMVDGFRKDRKGGLHSRAFVAYILLGVHLPNGQEHYLAAWSCEVNPV